MKKRKVLVTGGAGFIGSNLVRKLVENGNDVTVIDNFLTGHLSNIKDINNVNIIEGDIRDKKSIEISMQGIDVVFHLAASVGNQRSIDFPITDAEINVIGTINILEAARKFGVKKVVTSSSAGIYGELKTIPIKEDHSIEPDSPYGCTKLCEEKLCLSYSKMYNISVICLRYFNVYGPNQRFDAYGNVIPIFTFKLLNNNSIEIFGDGEQTRDFVHVNDVVQANLKAADAINISGAFNIGSGNSISLNKLVDIISKNISNDCKINFGKERVGDVRHSLADISSAKLFLNYNPIINIENGIADYINWAKDYLERQ